MTAPTDRRRLLPSLAAFIAAAAAVWFGHADMARAEPPQLQMPLECEIGVDCWVLRYFDHDPGEGTKDHECGFLTGDDHRGIDIRVRDYVAMRDGVVVVAAADGVVKATRDGVEDISVADNPDSRDEVSKYGLGNTVIINHGDGWQTAYGHMMKGSVLVREGDRVTAGQPIGMVGLSGLTTFPHMHFMVKHNGEALDPFTGLNPDPACGDVSQTLWSPEALDELKYIRTVLLIAGFSDVVPDADDAENGLYDQSTLRPDGEVIAFWYHLMGANKGDQETLRITAPNGRVVVEREKTYQRNRVLAFDFIGDKLNNERLPSGIYRAEYQLVRNVEGTEQVILSRTFEINVP